MINQVQNIKGYPEMIDRLWGFNYHTLAHADEVTPAQNHYNAKKNIPITLSIILQKIICYNYLCS